MPRYAEPDSYIADDLDNGDYPMLAEITLPESKPVDTGLLWANGKPVMRYPNPIGFGRNEEW